jgi:hypothetical protein
VCTIKKEARREVLNKIIKAQAIKLQPSSKLNGGEGSYKLKVMCCRKGPIL